MRELLFDWAVAPFRQLAGVPVTLAFAWIAGRALAHAERSANR
jgi:hypothetical protein